MQQPEQILKRFWGYDRFRPLQKDIISNVLKQADTLALLPTGGGKSLCYQLPALMLPGVTLVITPLIALMHDQVERLQQLDIPAAYIDSGMHRSDLIRTLKNAIEGAYKLLYISPERLQTHTFNEYLPAMDVRLIAVDEAHCISQWGHDFRPDYLKVAMLRNVFRDVPVIAVTASATPKVEEDIMLQLGMKGANVFRQSFERTNIYYDIRYSENKLTEVTEHLSQNRGSSIIYCRSRKQTEHLSKQLNNAGFDALAYHAGMTADKRKDHQQRWLNDSTKIMVATTAFGMGIDKPDVRSVIHYDVPEHIEAFYQESGRAGRDDDPATSLLLYNQTDLNRLEESTDTQFPPYDFIRKVYQSVAEYLQIPIGTEPYRYYNFELADFCKKFKLPALPTSRALKLLEQEGLWTLTEAVFSPSTALMLADRQEIDNLGRNYPELGVLITTLLRLYGTLFYHPTAINPKVVAKHLRVKQTVVIQLLQQLDKMEILEFNQPKEGPQLFFHHYRVNSEHLIINTDRINALKKAHKTRTEAIIQFITGDVCRNVFMLHYFGQNYNKHCGHCDICNRNEYVTVSDKEIQQVILASFATSEIELSKLVQQLADYDKEIVMNNIRRLLDENTLGLRANTILYIKQPLG